jgi:hypothetical protein
MFHSGDRKGLFLRGILIMNNYYISLWGRMVKQNTPKQ